MANTILVKKTSIFTDAFCYRNIYKYSIKKVGLVKNSTFIGLILKVFF